MECTSLGVPRFTAALKGDSRTENKLGAAKSNKKQVGLLPVAPKQWGILELMEEVLR